MIAGIAPDAAIRACEWPTVSKYRMLLDVRALVLAALVVSSSRADAGRGARSLELLADYTAFVLVVDVAHARQTPMVRHAIELLRAHYAWWGELAKACIEPEKLADTVVVAGSGELASSDHHTVIIVEGKLDKLVGKLTRGAPSAKQGGVTVWTVDGNELAMIDRKLVVTAIGNMAHVLERARGKHERAPDVRAMLEATSPGTDAFGGVLVDPAQRGQLAVALDGEPRWIACSLAAATQLVIDIRIELADEVMAGKVRARLAGRFGDPTMQTDVQNMIGKEFSDSISIDQDHTQVRMSATLTSDEVEKVFGLLKMF